ncbi:ORF27 [Ranid herpesvirus 1]|uniref:ORF27 n=1 Tax=Ranid herpesvirus 1 TaxID=85655 RepID=Q14VT1_9VIRU|nr:ORF27 [Ranid herpesvirus 1]ABG25714.1 ORF27 [Ranid herpesvirus 1]
MLEDGGIILSSEEEHSSTPDNMDQEENISHSAPCKRKRKSIYNLRVTGCLFTGHHLIIKHMDRVLFYIEEAGHQIFYVHNDTCDGSVVRNEIVVENGIATVCLGPGRAFANPECVFRDLMERFSFKGEPSNAVTLRWRVTSPYSFLIVPVALWWTPITPPRRLFSHTPKFLYPEHGQLRLCSSQTYVQLWNAMGLLKHNTSTPHAVLCKAPRVSHPDSRPPIATVCDTNAPASMYTHVRHYQTLVERVMSGHADEQIFMGTHYTGQRYVRVVDADGYVSVSEAPHRLLPNPRLPPNVSALIQRLGAHSDFLKWDMLSAGFFPEHSCDLASLMGGFYGVPQSHCFRSIWAYAASTASCCDMNTLHKLGTTQLPRLPSRPLHHRAVECGERVYSVQGGEVCVHTVENETRGSTAKKLIRCCCGALLELLPRGGADRSVSEFIRPAVSLMQDRAAFAAYTLCAQIFQRVCMLRAPPVNVLSAAHTVATVLAHFAASICRICNSEQLVAFLARVCEAATDEQPPPAPHCCGEDEHLNGDVTYAAEQLCPLSRSYVLLDAALYSGTHTHTATVQNGMLVVRALTETTYAAYACSATTYSALRSVHCEATQSHILLADITQRGEWGVLAVMPYAVHRYVVLLLQERGVTPAALLNGSLCTTHCAHVRYNGRIPVVKCKDTVMLFGHPYGTVSRSTLFTYCCLDRPAVRRHMSRPDLVAAARDELDGGCHGSALLIAVRKVYMKCVDASAVLQEGNTRESLKDVVASVFAFLDSESEELYEGPHIESLYLLIFPTLYGELVQLCCLAKSRAIVCNRLHEVFAVSYNIIADQDTERPIAPSALRWLKALLGTRFPHELHPHAYTFPPELFNLMQWCINAAVPGPPNVLSCCVCLEDDSTADTFTMVVFRCRHYTCVLCHSYLIAQRAAHKACCPLCRTALCD